MMAVFAERINGDGFASDAYCAVKKVRLLLQYIADSSPIDQFEQGLND